MHINNKSLELIDGEVFKPVSGYEDLYSVSNMGRIRSEKKTVRCLNGYRTLQQSIMIINVDNRHHDCRVKLSNDGFKKDFMVSHLVALEFLGSWDKSTHIIMHKNKNPMDNRAENLDITTWKESVFIDFYLKHKLPRGIYYEKKYVTRKNKKITHIICTGCGKKKPVKEYWKSAIVDNEVRMYICAECCTEKWSNAKDQGKHIRYTEFIEKGYKICQKCHKKKKLSQFNKNKNRQGGVGVYCNKCSTEIGRKYFSYQGFNDKIAKRNKKIVKMYDTGKYSQQTIANMYGITQSAVFCVLKNNR